jgi:hypothetical protein
MQPDLFPSTPDGAPAVLNAATIAAIRTARLQGRSYRQLAEEHGTTPEAVRAVCRAPAAK